MSNDRPLSTLSSDSLARAANVPLPAGDDDISFPEPRPPFLSAPSNDSPRDSYVGATPNDSGTHLAPADKVEVDHEKSDPTPEDSPKKKRRGVLLAAVGAALIIIILAVILPVYFTVIKPKNNKADATTGSGSTGGTGTGPSRTISNTAGPGATVAPTEPVWGASGSTVTATDGSTFTYENRFGGIWYSDPNDPFNNNAYPNSWTPPLNQTWDYGTSRMFGVNLGGWFVLEPFISPEIFQRYPGTIDEWTLSEAMAADTANGGLAQLEEHYKTFITEQDIAMIAGAGLNWVRLPIPFWAVDKLPEEPFLEKVSWPYIIQALQWCRKYGLRVKLDLHTIPGSHNGWNHSGKRGDINFLSGVMGVANAQRALNYMRIITEFISQPEWKDVVLIFGIMNEARPSEIGSTALRGFYVEAYKMIREITGIGAGNGPFISLHDGFMGLGGMADFLPGADRVAVDQHPYLAFSGGANNDPVDTGIGPGAGGIWPGTACDRWASAFNTSRNTFGVSLAGEWSNGINDCGLFLNGVGGTTTYGGDCAIWEDSSNWSEGTKAGLMAFTMASMDSFRDWFFWTWRIGESIRGIVETPLWSYKEGLERGWMPLDPRLSIGACGPERGPSFDGIFDLWQTGAVSSTVLDINAQTAQYPFPPLAVTNAAGPGSLLPTYTTTGTIATLPAPTYTDLAGNTIPAGNGWSNPQDTRPAPTPIQGCVYPDPWNANNLPVPPPCGGTVLEARTAEDGKITPAPSGL